MVAGNEREILWVVIVVVFPAFIGWHSSRTVEASSNERLKFAVSQLRRTLNTPVRQCSRFVMLPDSFAATVHNSGNGDFKNLSKSVANSIYQLTYY